jgi:hypothetical protein
MGSANSTYASTVLEGWLHPEFRPNIFEQPTNDPLFGFEDRKEKGLLFKFYNFNPNN